MSKKILLVDDEPDILRMLEIRLKHAGYETATACNGKEALEILKKDPIDLILLDLLMPVMDGREVCKIMKNDEKLKNIPIMLLTASVSTAPEDIKKELQATDIIIKPFQPEDLLQKIKKLVEL